MNARHLSFEQLVDWAEGRLDEAGLRVVLEHLSKGCTACEREVSWLQRFLAAVTFDEMTDPPRELVVRAKALAGVRAPEPEPRGRLKPRPFLLLLRWGAAAIGLLLLCVAAASQVPWLYHRDATLVAVEGQVEVQRVTGAQWVVAGPGQRLGEGDSLRVLTGTALVSLFDGSELEIHATTELALQTLRSGWLSASHRVSLQQHSGTVQYTVARLAGLTSTFETQTSSVLVSVHGTRFVVTVENESEARVAVLQGAVLLTSREERAVLQEREVVLASSRAALQRLPTLLPTATQAPARGSTATVVAPPSCTTTPVAAPARAMEPSATAPLARPSEAAAPGGQVVPLAPAQTRFPITATSGLAGTKSAPTHTPTVTESKPLAHQPVQFRGSVDRMPVGGLGQWWISGRPVWVDRETEVVGQPHVGDPVWVLCTVREPAMSRARPDCRALRIWLVRATDTPRPPVTPGAPWSPIPTPSSTAEEGGQPVTTPTRPVLPNQTRTARLSATPGASPTQPAAVVPGPGRTPTGTPLPPYPPPALVTRTPDLPPSASTATPMPSVPPRPSPVHFGGMIQRLPPGRLGIWVVDGRQVAVTPQTDVQGDPAVGIRAEVEALEHANGALVAVKIVVYNPATNL